MASVASQLIEEITAHAQSDSLEDAREICAGGTYFPNNLRTLFWMFDICWFCYFLHYLTHEDETDGLPRNVGMELLLDAA